MQSSAAVRATSRKQQIPQLWMVGRGRGVDCFVLWTYPIWEQCPNTFVADFQVNSWLTVRKVYLPFCGEIKQLRRRQQWKHHWKMNLRPFKLYRVYLEPLNSSNEGDFCWSWILKGFIHVEICRRMFHIEVVQWTSKKCAKKRDAREELLFWLRLLLS